MHAIFWGMAVMIIVIVLMDQFVWRPVIAWANKFKFERAEGTAPRSFALTLLRRSGFLATVHRRVAEPVEERLMSAFARRMNVREEHSATDSAMKKWTARAVGSVALVALAWLAIRALVTLARLGAEEFVSLARDASFTFLRVKPALVSGAFGTVPV